MSSIHSNLSTPVVPPLVNLSELQASSLASKLHKYCTRFSWDMLVQHLQCRWHFLIYVLRSNAMAYLKVHTSHFGLNMSCVKIVRYRCFEMHCRACYVVLYPWAVWLSGRPAGLCWDEPVWRQLSVEPARMLHSQTDWKTMASHSATPEAARHLH